MAGLKLLTIVCVGCLLTQAQETFYLTESDHVFIFTGESTSALPDLAAVRLFLTTRYPVLDVQVSQLEATSMPPEKEDQKHAVLVLFGRDSAPGSWVHQKLLQLSQKLPEARVRFMQSPEHPHSPVQLAADLLTFWNAQKVVSRVEIEASAGRIEGSQNTMVRDLETGRVLAWSQDDTALPLPTTLANEPAFQALNVETLQVRGLASGKYRLTIDGWSMGEFWRDDFEKGIDLTRLATPMSKQADSLIPFVAADSTGTSPSDKANWRRLAIARTHDYEIAPAGSGGDSEIIPIGVVDSPASNR